MTIYTCQYCGKPNEFAKRSNKQNAYMHLALTILGNELGYDVNEAKQVMKHHFGMYKELVDKKTGESIIIYDETSKMNSKEMSEFIEKIIRFAAEQGIVIDSPEDYYSK